MARVRVFISWGGARAETVARALHDWLPKVLQVADPWTAHAIEGGTQWTSRLSAALQEHDFGILCVTREATSRPWLYFEGGALAQRDRSRVIPYLIDEDAIGPDNPLWLLQHRKADRADTLKLMLELYEVAKEHVARAFDENRLRESFEQHWPTLEGAIQSARGPEVVAEAPTSAPVDSRQVLQLLRTLMTGQQRLFERLEGIEKRLHIDAADPVAPIVGTVSTLSGGVEIREESATPHLAESSRRGTP